MTIKMYMFIIFLAGASCAQAMRNNPANPGLDLSDFIVWTRSKLNNGGRIDGEDANRLLLEIKRFRSRIVPLARQVEAYDLESRYERSERALIEETRAGRHTPLGFLVASAENIDKFGKDVESFINNGHNQVDSDD